MDHPKEEPRESLHALDIPEVGSETPLHNVLLARIGVIETQPAELTNAYNMFLKSRTSTIKL